MNTPNTWSVVSATTVCDNYNNNNKNNNNYRQTTNLSYNTADTTTSVHSTTAAGKLSRTHKADHHTSHKRGNAVHKNLPAILLDSWEVHKLTGPGSVFVNSLLAADVDNDDKDEIIIGTTEGKVLVMKGCDRQPCFLHTLCATVSFIVYDAEKRELVIVTLEGQCEILRNFMVKSLESVHPTVVKTLTVSSSSAGLSSIVNQTEKENGDHVKKVHMTMRHSASSPQFPTKKTYPCEQTKVSHKDSNNNNNTKIENNDYCEEESKVERKIFFHVAANCTCGVVCKIHTRHNNKSNEAAEVQNVLFAGSYDCRLYAYDTEKGTCLLTLFVEHPITSMTHVKCPVKQSVQMPESVSAADLTHSHFWYHNNNDHYSTDELQNNTDDISCINVGDSNKCRVMTSNIHDKPMLSLLCMVVGEKLVMLPTSIEEMVSCCRCDENLVYDDSNKTPIYLALQTHTEQHSSQEHYQNQDYQLQNNTRSSNAPNIQENNTTRNVNNTDDARLHEGRVDNQLEEGSVFTTSTSVLSSMSPETMVTAAAKSFSTAQTNNAPSELAIHKRVSRNHRSTLSHNKGKHHHSSTWVEEVQINKHGSSAHYKIHFISPLCEINFTDNLVCAYSAHDVHSSNTYKRKHSHVERSFKTYYHNEQQQEQKQEEKELDSQEQSQGKLETFHGDENVNIQNDTNKDEECEEEEKDEENDKSDSDDSQSDEHVHFAMVVNAAVHPSCHEAIIVLVREDGKMGTLSLQACQLDDNVTQQYNLSAMEVDEVSMKEVILYNDDDDDDVLGAAPHKYEGNALYFYNFNQCEAAVNRDLANKSKNKNTNNNNIYAENSPVHALLQLSCNWAKNITQSHLIPRVQLLNCSGQEEYYYNNNTDNTESTYNDMVAFCLADNGEAFCVSTTTYRVIHTFVRDDSSSFVIATDNEKDHNQYYTNKNYDDSSMNNIELESKRNEKNYTLDNALNKNTSTNVQSVLSTNSYWQNEERQQRQSREEITCNKQHHLRGLLRHFHSRSLSCFCVSTNELCMYAVDELVQAAENPNTDTSCQRKINVLPASQSATSSSAQATTSQPAKSVISKVVSNMSFQSDAATEITSVSVSAAPTINNNNTEVEIDNNEESEKSDDELLLELGELIQTLYFSDNCRRTDTTNVSEQPLESVSDEEQTKRAIIQQTRDLLLYGFSDEE